MRYCVKHFLLTVSAVVIYFGIAQSAGYWTTAGIFLATALVAWSLLSKRRRAFIFIRLAVGSVGLAAIWFLAVDWSWFVEDCPDCLIRRDVVQYRVLGYCVYEKIDATSTILERALTDLGTPCLHERLERWQKHRWWGLLVCGLPCWNGIDGLSAADDRYTPELSARVRARGEQDPKLAAELHRRIVKLHDYNFFWDAFMTDELAPRWLEAPSTHEALSWLKTASDPDSRSVSFSRTTDESIQLIKSVYEAGAIDILAIEIGEPGNSSREVAGGLLVKLPQDETSRRNVLARVNQCDEDRKYPCRDYGQAYVHFLP